MDINPHIFREFSIRGIADDDLTDDVVTRIGQAIGTFFRTKDHRLLVLGRDVRVSSDRIARAVIRGVRSTGLNLFDIGMVPTPLLNFTTDFQGADCGVMITASHNPPAHNGLKIRSDRTLQDAEIQELYQLASSQSFVTDEPGTVRQIDPLPDYLHHLKRHAKWKELPLRIVVDGGNGTNGLIVSSLLTDFGCDVVELFCEPDGSFPNRKPDPTSAGATAALADRVLATDAQLGIAYDGDGDRLVAVDDRGQTIFGDQLLMLFARDVLQQGPARIVYEILCTQALADDVRAHGGQAIMTPSGYAFVHDSMRESEAAVGGELSGHFFFNEPHFHFDDAILATIKLLNIIAGSRRPLSQLVGGLPAYHSSPELRVKCPDESKGKVVARVRAKYRDLYHVEEIDGARIHFPGGWALVRQSNTQPVMSMRFEAQDAERLAAIQSEVQALVEAYIKEAETT